jgi:hypothetical protein
MATSHPHGSRRIGVGSFTAAASHPFNRRFFARLDRSSLPRRRPAPERLLAPMGNAPGWNAVAAVLALPNVQDPFNEQHH